MQSAFSNTPETAPGTNAAENITDKRGSAQRWGFSVRKTDQLLNSSHLRSADYDFWSATLTIEFHHGGVYEYYGVPPVIYDSLVAAESPGRFHHLYIKGRYPFRRVS